MAARMWFAGKLGETGLATTIDGIGNVVGRSVGDHGKVLLLGSHLETQPFAGWLDGSLGTLFALEVVRAIKEADLPYAVDVGAWADEEGHFGTMLGSRSFCGMVSEETIDQARSKATGQPMREALADAGLAGRERVVMDPARYAGYLEAHIEQGDFLDSSGLRLGIVTGIVGIRTFRLASSGQQNHAGTTRMAARRDAGAALLRLWQAINSEFEANAGPTTVWTFGRMAFEPGAPSVIPGRAEATFQFRDEDPDRLARLEARLDAAVAAANHAGPCLIESTLMGSVDPSAMSKEFQEALERSAERFATGAHVRMPSGAGHDAQVFARCIPAGMLFVPSIGGISHHPDEDTADTDIVLGCQVFADAVVSLSEMPAPA
jgi:N-carbamoyl-L-amino-acid hydrolase